MSELPTRDTRNFGHTSASAPCAAGSGKTTTTPGHRRLRKSRPSALSARARSSRSRASASIATPFAAARLRSFSSVSGAREGLSDNERDCQTPTLSTVTHASSHGQSAASRCRSCTCTRAGIRLDRRKLGFSCPLILEEFPPLTIDSELAETLSALCAERERQGLSLSEVSERTTTCR